ncbi:antitermination regulator [Lachnoclostridium sp. An14]|uniref:ANTAR domain-containing response regulator n=1 Tax=Lachnoclostridium sp. An14 TaxID=1965562 RepID=UPI000B3714DC|nr:ANTAR domain-containing protein [Lachnoclostridium sp. An14]OUQ13961.1 antitermination regulator [Lachnoclostridium sp. An14]
MPNVIVAFSKQENGKNIRNILVKNGFHVVAVCTSGAQILAAAGELDRGIVVGGGKFQDMVYGEVCRLLPEEFSMLVVAQAAMFGDDTPENAMLLPMPLRVHELVSTLEMMIQTQERRHRRRRRMPKARSREELELIDRAKEMLMDRNHMTEDEAHRYIQKCSMSNGSSLVETAEMIISLIA